MVAIVSGSGLGLQRTSGSLLGSAGQLGGAGLGRDGGGVWVNAATGNLVLSRQDEVLVATGGDVLASRTYNSRGLLNDDNGDNWRMGLTRRVVQTSGSYGTAGSTVTRTDWDGSELVYTWDAGRNAYVSKEGAGAFDTVALAGNTWTWTDGDSRGTELYDAANSGRITAQKDADGNATTYTYGASNPLLITSVTRPTQDQYVFTYSGNNLTSVKLRKYDVPSGTYTETTTTRYTYDAQNRLSRVDVDFTPGDGTVADGNSYWIQYTYKDSTSRLVTGITQKDGTSLTVVYDGANRVQSVTQAMDTGVSQTTTFAYNPDPTDANKTVTKVVIDAGGQSLVYRFTSNNATGLLTRLEEPAPVNGGGNPTFKTYDYDADGNVLAARTFGSLADVGNDALALEIARSRYDANGNLLERVFGDSSAVFYTYGALNEVLTETHYTGFDANGLADGAAPSGTAMVTRYVYDEAGNGVADDGTASGDDAAEKHLRFTISAEGRVTEYRYDATGRLTARIDYVGNAYAGSIWTEAALAGFVAGADKSQTQRSDYGYDWRSNVAQVISYSVTQASGAGHGSYDYTQIDYTYDMAGRLLSRRTSGYNALGGEPALTTETFVYDSLGRVISATDLLGVTSTIVIDDGARTTTITTPNEATRTQTFAIGGMLKSEAVTAAGTATATTTYSYDALGRLRKATDASGLSTYYTYDRQNRLTATIDADGSICEYRYDGADRLVATVHYATAASAASLTALGNAATNTEVATIRPAVSASDRWAWTIYDHAGQVIETIDAAGAAITFSYDGAGRLVTTTAWSAKLATGTVNGADGISGYRAAIPTSAVLPAANISEDRITQNLYDKGGALIGTAAQIAGSGAGRITEYVYDNAGRLLDTVNYANLVAQASWQGKGLAEIKSALTLDAANDIHNYRIYDGRGRKIAAIDGAGNVTRYHYTARGDLDQEIRGQKVTAATAYTMANLPAASGTLETTRWYRNAAGLVTSQVRTLTSGTETTSYAYDNRGRLLTQTTAETVSSETRTQTMRYDAKGRLTGQLSGVGSAALAALGASPSQAQIDSVYATYGTRYAYDVADRLIQTITPDGSGASGVKTFYYYDSDGQLRFEINGLGEVTEYRYNALEDRSDTIAYGTLLSSATLATLSGGLVTAAITNSVLPVAQGGIGDSTKDSRVQASYDNLGRIIAAIDALGYTTTSQYNAFSQVNQVNGPTVAAPNLGALVSYGYYPDGQLSYSQTSVNGVNGAALYQGYTYDAAGRRTGVAQNTYDNRTSTWAYDRANRAITQRDNLYNAATLGYDSRSNLISSTDRTGKTTSFAYDLANRNVTMTTAEGVSSSVKKNAYGQTILLTDGKGNTTSYAYDKDGNLKTVTDAAGTTTSNYDNAGRVIDVIDAKGVDTHYTYDAVGRALTEVSDYGSGKLNLTTTYAYDAKGQVISVTDASGMITTYSYDLKGDKARVVQDAGSGKLNLTTDFVYRADGKVISQTDAVGTAQQRRTAFEYDTAGRLTKRTLDADGTNALSTSYFHDVNNNQIAVVEASNTAQARTTRFVYDLSNRLTATIDALGNVTQYFYDGEDRAVSSRTFINALSTAQLAAFADHAQPNQWTETSTAANGDLTLTRKVKDLVTNAVTSATVATLAAAPSDRVTRTFYDGDGRAVYVLDGEGYAIQNVYDKADNVIQTIRYALQTSLTNSSTTANVAALFTTTQSNGGLATNVPASAVVTTYAYDAANRLTDVTDGEGAVTHFVLDALGLKTDITAGFGTADAVTTHYVYDALGRVTDETRAYNTGNASDPATTHYVYDGLGRVTDATVASNSTSGEAVTTHRTYDALGRVLSETRAFGTSEAATTQYVYDTLGRVVKTVDPLSNASYLFYDNLDRVTQQVDAEGYVTKTEYLNGAANTRVTRYYTKATNAATLTPSTQPAVTADAAHDVVVYAFYDKADRLVWSVDGEGYAVKTTYQIGGSIASVTRYANKASNAATLTLDGAPTVTAGADATTLFTYDRSGRVLTATDAEGGVESYAYDALDQRTSFTNKLGGTTTYTFYKTGLVKTESVQQKSYDDTGTALLDGAATASSVVTTYTYDPRGNLKTKAVGSNLGANALVTSYAYDKLDRPTQQTDPFFANPDGSGTLTPVSQWAYDKRGDVIQQTASDGGKTFSYYDKLGRKVAEVSPVGTLSQWTYDANGNLTNQKIWSSSVALPGTAGGSPPAALANDTARETTLSYDKVGRLTQTVIVGVRTGSYTGTAYVTTASQNLTSANLYDGFGNLIKEVDANGNAIHHWYDRAGREVVKLDQEQYLTGWTRDADGNVTAETRFATRYAGTFNPAAAAPTVSADAVNDRTTQFSYDKMGRRLTEARLNVIAATISGNTVSTASQSATIGYSYNKLGEVLSKTEATGDKTDYQYDAQGRLIRQLDAVQADFTASGAATVRHVTYFKYDGANNLVQATERAEAGSAVADAALTPDAPGAAATGYVAGAAGDDRITKNSYSGGKLTAMTDAAGFTHSYVYDGAGRKAGEYYTRTKSDGSSVIEGSFTAYDLAGRATSQWQASATTPVNPVWSVIWPKTLLNYNAYGEVTSRAVKASAADTSPLTQEQMTYDNAGRVVKTNAGDGVWKVMVYDANGNATLTLSAITADLSGITVDQALTSFGAIDTSADQTMAPSISVYDKRNMAATTREPMRQVDGTANRYTITRSRTYTAFGEVASDTDARGNTTDYTYTMLGRMARSEAPTVSITNEDGSVQFVRPASDNYYDASGRLVATRDANGTYAAGGTVTAGTSKAANSGNLITRQLLAGTGYGGSEAKVQNEYRADGSIWASRYDAFGQLRVSVDGINSAFKAANLSYVTTNQLTDKANRVTQITHPATGAGTLVESFAYDGLGNRIKSWNNFYGTAQAERTDYDAQGRVTLQVSQGGDRIATTYSWSSTLTNTGLGLAGGWIKTANYQDENALTIKTIVTKADSFGHEVEKTDMGGHVFASSYDKGGRLTARGAQAFTWFNTGQLASTSGDFGTESYNYDAAGNRAREYLTLGAQVRKDAAAYDAMNRMISWNEAATAILPDASTLTSYDANGNIRRTQATWRTLDQYGAPNPYAANSYNYWYRYDALNRLVTDMGSLSGTAGASGTTIVRGINGSNDPQAGRDIFYDANGQRISIATTFCYVGHWEQQTPPNTLPTPDDPYVYVAGWWQEQRENYTFDSAGHLTEVRNTAGSQVNEAMDPDGNGTGAPSGPITPGSATGGGLRSALGYDLLGRQISQQDQGWATGSYFTGTLYSRTISYNAKNQVISDDASTVKSQYGNNSYDTFRTVTTYSYGSGSSYALGSVISQSAVNTKLAAGSSSWSNQPGTLTQTSYSWYDGAVQAAVYHDSDTGDSNTIASVTSSGNFGGGTKVFRTTYTPNALGQVAGAAVQDGIPKTNSYVLDAAGQIIRHDESRNAAPGEGAPHEAFYRFGGKQIGVSGNNGTGGAAYTQSVTQRSAATPSQSDTTAGLFRDGTKTGAAAYADFSQSYTAYNVYSQGSAGGSYTVRGGDTLQGIAQALWGDANLWYKLAEANGLSGSASLSEGQKLTLPSGVTRSAHNASTFKPYDAAEALGNTLPATPKPPKGNKCGVFGQILLAVVTIAIGNIGGQLFGMATGLQQGGFNWKSLGISVATAAVQFATAGLANFAVFGSQFLGDVARGAAISTLTQGISSITRLQDKISWSGVAAAGVMAGVSGAVTRGLNHNQGHFVSKAETGSYKMGVTAPAAHTWTWNGRFSPVAGSDLAASMASGIAGAATRSVIDGTDFGDNLLAALPDVIAQTIMSGVSSALHKTKTDSLEQRFEKESAEARARYSGKPPAAITALDGLELTTNDGLADAIKQLAEFPTVQLAQGLVEKSVSTHPSDTVSQVAAAGTGSRGGTTTIAVSRGIDGAGNGDWVPVADAIQAKFDQDWAENKPKTRADVDALVQKDNPGYQLGSAAALEWYLNPKTNPNGIPPLLIKPLAPDGNAFDTSTCPDTFDDLIGGEFTLGTAALAPNFDARCIPSMMQNEILIPLHQAEASLQALGDWLNKPVGNIKISRMADTGARWGAEFLISPTTAMIDAYQTYKYDKDQIFGSRPMTNGDVVTVVTAGLDGAGLIFKAAPLVSGSVRTGSWASKLLKVGGEAATEATVLRTESTLIAKAEGIGVERVGATGSATHKAARWGEYQARGGGWNYDRWSNVYDKNMSKARLANEAVDAYHQTLGWGRREVTVNAEVDGVIYARRLDIADVNTLKGVEYKVGYQTATKDNLWEVTRDQALIQKSGWSIQWVLRDNASKPLTDALTKAGIRYTLGN